MNSGRLCKLRCFPYVALRWDPASGLNVFPNLNYRTIEVDSLPALWSSTQGSEQTNFVTGRFNMYRVFIISLLNSHKFSIEKLGVIIESKN
ncbi:hypothetical protein Hanom_Chr14g01267701 [Helianthus anomalus]